jgi:hypothetical protein
MKASQKLKLGMEQVVYGALAATWSMMRGTKIACV